MRHFQVYSDHFKISRGIIESKQTRLLWVAFSSGPFVCVDLVTQAEVTVGKMQLVAHPIGWQCVLSAYSQGIQVSNRADMANEADETDGAGELLGRY